MIQGADQVSSMVRQGKAFPTAQMLCRKAIDAGRLLCLQWHQPLVIELGGCFEQHASAMSYLPLLRCRCPRGVTRSQFELVGVGCLVQLPRSNLTRKVQLVERCFEQFSLGILSSVKIVTGRLKMDTSDMSVLPVEVWMNGVLAANFIGGGVYIYNAMGDGQTIALTVPVTLPSATPTEMFFELARRNAAGSDQSGRAVDDQRGHRPAQDYTDKCATVLPRKSPLIYL